jgi:hypothetical protein
LEEIRATKGDQKIGQKFAQLFEKVAKTKQWDQKIGQKFAQLFEKVAKTVTKPKIPLSV